MDALTLFGLFAVTMMLVCYAAEDRSPWFILAFAVSCALGSAYGFLQGACWDRVLYVRPPADGLPEVTLDDSTMVEAVPKTALLRAKKAVYGTADAPYEWDKEHDAGLQEVGLVTI